MLAHTSLALADNAAISEELVQILLVEADDADAEAVQRQLSVADGGGFSLHRVRDLPAAIGHLAGGEIDLVLLEPALPNCQGLEALASLLKLAPSVPVVVLTNMGDDPCVAAVRIGAQGYLIKGEADHRLLKRTLRFAIERNRSVQQYRRLTSSIAAAQDIQRHLLPAEVPQLPGFDLAAGCFPAERCSGDFYDFIRMRGCLTVLVADVAGHGLGPAMLGAAVSAYLEAGAALHQDIHEMLTLANWLIAKKADGQFVTLFSARIDARKRTFVYCAAGHHAHLISSAGKVTVLNATICPLGIDDHEVSSLSFRLHFRPGDILLLMTDGIWEAISPQQQQFGIERALRVVHSHRSLSAQEIVATLHHAVLDFTWPYKPMDDITMVVVKALDAPPQDDTALEGKETVPR